MTKKVLSLTLALVLVLSIMTGVTLTASAGALPALTDEFIIAEFNFENGLDGFTSIQESEVELVEEAGNKYMSVKPALSAEEIISGSGAGTLGRDFWMMGFNKKDLSIPADNTKNYFFRANVKLESGSAYFQADKLGNSLGEVLAESCYEAFVADGNSSKQGWTVYESNWYLNNIASVTDGYFNQIYMKSNLSRELCLAMGETATYAGKGLGGYVAAKWPMNVDGTDYYLSGDCSNIGDDAATKAARLEAYLEANPIGYYIDDIQLITTGVSTYSNTVTINGEDASVTAVVNPNVSDGTINVESGDTITVNDYYGVTVSINPASDDVYIKSVTYGGRALDVTVDEETGAMNIVIPASKVTDAALVVDTAKVTASTPSISDVKVKGDAEVGSILEVDYKYGGNTKDASTFQWQKFVNGEWKNIDNATAKEYEVQTGDINSYLRAVITPKNEEGESWKDVITPSVYIGVLEFFVATNGNDSTGDGSIKKPFATVGAARDALRALIADELLPQGEVFVNIRGGEYNVTAATTFSGADSAPEGTTITYRSYPGETATFVGSTKIANSKVSKVTEDDMIGGLRVFDRVTDPLAQENLYKIDLSELKGEITPLTEWGWADSNVHQGTWSGEYRPSELFVDGHILSWSRWPNEEEDNAMTYIASVETSSNFANEPSKIVYKDDNDETVNWNGDLIKKDMLIWGYMGSHWCANAYQVSEFDPANKTVTTKNGTYTMPTRSYPMYFFNILEAIDMPGESFIDRENNVAYFYAPGEITNVSDVRMSTYDGSMFSFNGASNIKLDGIEMKYTKNQPLLVSGTDKFNVENCVFAHGTKAANLSGYNITFKNNLVTQNGYGGITIDGGDRATLTPSNNIVENNIFTHNGRIRRVYAPSITLNGVGITVKGNELAYNPHEVITINTGNDIEICENYIHHACNESGDMGAIYWGRNPSVLGVTIHDNYFYRISNVYNNGWSQSIFADDGNYGAEVYNNIFYQGTLTTDRGGKTANSYAFKTNGGQHFRLTNNIFVDMPSSAYFQSWVSTGFESPMQGRYIVFHNNVLPVDTSNGFDKAVFDFAATATGFANQWGRISDYCDSQIWKDAYEGTMYENFFDEFSTEKYNKLREFGEEGRYDKIIEYVNTYAPSRTNIFDNNVNVKIDKGGPTEHGNEVITNNYASNDLSIFKDWKNHDFELTDEGLAKVRESAKDFKNVSMDNIGADGVIGNTYAPVISSLSITGNAVPGGKVKTSYVFFDPDGDTEGSSVYSWWASETADGTYTRIYNNTDDVMIVPEEAAGKYIKVEVEPYDSTMRHGEKVVSEPVFVSADISNVDKTELWDAITEATELANSAVIGTETGTYSQKSVDDLNAAIETAKAVANAVTSYQYQVNSAAKALANAINKFKLSQNMSLEFMNITDIISDAENWYATSGEPVIDKENKTITLKNNDEITYTGKKYLNTMFGFKMKLVPLNDKETTAINADPASHDVNGVGFVVRRQNKDGFIWTTNGYLMWMKNLTYELQEFAGSNTINSYPNTVFTEFNKTYDVVFGAYDSNGKTRLVLYVDGKLIGDNEFTDKMIGIDGFLGFRTPDKSPVGLIIEPADVDLSELEATIKEADELIKNGVVGSDYGQYPAEQKAALEAISADAKTLIEDKLVVQIPVDRKTLELKQAISDFKASAGDTIASASGSLDINYDIDEANITASTAGVTMNFNKEELTPEIKASNETPSGATASIGIPVGTKLSGENWNGQISTPVYSETPSGKVSSGITVNAVYTPSKTVVKADKPVRFVFPGVGTKRLYYKDVTGAYVEVRARAEADTIEAAKAAIGNGLGAAKLRVGNDMVVYSNFITEFVVFTTGAVDSDDNYSDDYVNGGTSSSAPTGGGTGSGFYTNSTATAGLDVNNTFIFSDMATHWARTDVMSMYNAGIVSGVTADTFEPDRNITRAEFATLIVKALKLKNGESNFVDVAGDDWFAPYVGSAAKAGIIVGSDGNFRPNDTITRQEMAVIVVKAYEYLGKVAEIANLTFSDNAEVSSWAKGFVAKAVGAGLISGMGDNIFAPKANATRAQSASLIARILK